MAKKRKHATTSKNKASRRMVAGNASVANPITSPPAITTSSQKLIGLNIYRAMAIFMMMAAHSVRIQANYVGIVTLPETATLFDDFLLLFITIEPIISAMFLFIAGFSLTLSYAKVQQQSAAEQQRWLLRIQKRAAALYGIAVVFFLAEYGFQWPDFIVSAGVLGTIALSIALSAALLVYGKTYRPLLLAALACILITYLLESQGWVITGLNAGAGGHLPLVVMGFLGTLYGMGYQKFADIGLYIGLLIALLVAFVAFMIDYPNTFVYYSEFSVYGQSLPQQWLQSALHLFDSDTAHSVRRAGFWNHASVFPLRYCVVIMFFMIIAMKALRSTHSPLLIFLNALGSYGLTIYVFHLVILAAIEVTGIKPVSGWQTLLLILALMGSGYLLIRNRIGMDPGTR